MKLENVLFSSEDKKYIKLVDFGISGKCKGNVKEKSDAGTIKYMPPEILSGENNQADPVIDVWCIGIMMFCMLYGEYPFYGSTKGDLIKNICEETLKIPDHTIVTEECEKLLK